LTPLGTICTVGGMSRRLRSFSELIGLWDSRAALGEDCDVDAGVVKQWDRRNSIPSAYWGAVVAGAARRKIEPEITFELLSRLAAGRRGAAA
jgi:hypothetical protein